MPRNWKATPATMVGTAGARKTSASDHRAAGLRLRVTTQEMLVASTIETTMAPAMMISVLRSGPIM